VLLDIGSVLGGVGLAVIGFVVVILVCVVILRLLAAILPSYEDRSGRAGADPAHDRPDDEETPTPEEVEEPRAPAAGGSTDDASTLASADPETVD
jgi:hypothetical protein